MNKSTKSKLKIGKIKTYWYPELINYCKICKEGFNPPKNRPYQEYCGKPECIKEKNRLKSNKHYQKYKEKIVETARIKREQFPEKHKEANRKFDKSGKRKPLTPKQKIKRNKNAREWNIKHPESTKETQHRHAISQQRKDYKKEHDKNPKHKINMKISNAIYQTLKGKNLRNLWEPFAGYTLEELKAHLEKQFTLGMTWENYGKWHIHHRMAKYFFEFETMEDEGFKDCWKLSNLQPLWKEEHMKKRIKKEKKF